VTRKGKGKAKRMADVPTRSSKFFEEERDKGRNLSKTSVTHKGPIGEGKALVRGKSQFYRAQEGGQGDERNEKSRGDTRAQKWYHHAAIGRKTPIH